MKKTILLLSLALTLNVSAQVPSYVPTTGLVGWWGFDGNANDESGNGNNGVVYGATLTADRNSVANTAYDFDGISNYIEVLSTPSLCVSSAYSISAWAFVINIAGVTNYEPAIVSKIVDGDWYGGYEVRAGSPMTSLGTSGNIGGTNISLNGLTSAMNAWYHIVVTYDGNKVKFYLNSICTDSLNITGTLQTSTIPLRFGRRGGAGTYNGWYPSKLDDIGIWNRALSQSEVAFLYQGCMVSVSSQPSNITVNVSNNAQFITSSSDTSATYQWQTNLGTGWMTLFNAGQYSGATNDTLTITNSTLTNNNQLFRCIISSSSCRADTSNIAILTVVNSGAGINDFSKVNMFSIYPNPATDVVFIESNSDIHQIKIINVLGQEVKSIQANSKRVSFSTTDLPDNIYFIQINNSNVRLKLIKTH